MSLNIVYSVENFTGSFTSTSGNNTLTRSQVAANCVPFFTSYNSSTMAGVLYNHFTDITLSGTTVSYSRTGSTGTKYYNTSIVEFNPFKVKVQQGSFSIASGSSSGSATISGVSSTGKAAFTFHYKTSDTSTTMTYHAVRGRFTSTSGIIFERGGTTGTVSGHYYVFEDLGDNFSVVHDSTSTSTIVYGNVSPPGIIHNTMCLGSYYVSTTTNPSYSSCRMFAYNDFSYGVRRTNSQATLYTSAQIIKFNVPTATYMVQRANDISLGSTTTTYSGTMTAVNLDTTSIHNPCMLGINQTDTTTVTNNEQIFTRAKISDSTTYVIEREETGSTATCPIEIVDWASYATYSGSAPATKLAALSTINSMVRSIEEVSCTITGDYYSMPLTKGQVAANCVPFLTYSCTGYRPADVLIDAYFIGDAYIRVMPGTNSATTYVKGYIVEFEPAQVKVQQGEFYTATSGTTTITTTGTMDMSKAAMKFYYAYHETGSDVFDYTAFLRGRISTTSGLEFYRYYGTTLLRGHYYIFEALNDQFTVQRGISTLSSTTDIAALTSGVCQDRTMLLGSYAYAGATAYPAYNTMMTAQYTKPYIKEFRSTATGNLYHAYTAITFKNNPLAYNNIQTQYKMLTIPANSGTGSYTLDFPVTSGTYIINNPPTLPAGRHYDASANTTYSGSFAYLTLTSGVVTATRPTNGYILDMLPQVIDFVGYPTTSGATSYTTSDSLIKSIEQFDFICDNRYEILFPTKGQNLNNCVPFYGAYSSNAGGFQKYNHPRIWFEDGKIKVDQLTHLTTSVYYTYGVLYLVEFNPLKVRIQSGDFVLNASTSTIASITSVDPTKSFLVFNYDMDATSSRVWAQYNVRGEITSSGTLTFSRGSSTNVIFGHYWVVETLDNDWSVYHTTVTGSSSTSLSTYFALDGNRQRADRSMILSSTSMSGSSTSESPAIGTFRGYTTIQPPWGYYYLDRNTNDYNAVHTIQAITFSEDSDVEVQHRGYVGLTGTTYTSTVDIFDSVDANAIVFNPNMNGFGTLNTTNSGYLDKSFYTCKIVNSGTQVTVTTPNPGSADFYGGYTIVQWPLKSYDCAGSIVVDDMPASGIEVRLYERDSGDLVESTISSTPSGIFSFGVQEDTDYYAVALYTDDTRNALIYDWLSPTIS